MSDRDADQAIESGVLEIPFAALKQSWRQKHELTSPITILCLAVLRWGLFVPLGFPSIYLIIE